MLRLYGCIVEEHDLRLVALAALVALAGCLLAVDLLAQARTLAGRSRWLWVAGSAAATGLAAWTMHFVAMLAYHPAIPIGYDVALTVQSLVLVCAVAMAGLAIATRWPGWGAEAGGGAVVGAAVAAMHYLGMAGMRLPGYQVWDGRGVAASVAVACGLAAAMPVALRVGRRCGRGLATALLVGAVCGLHFTAMSAVTLVLDGSDPPPTTALSSPLLAGLIAFVALVLLLLLSITAVRLARRMARQREAERVSLRTVADIAVEGLLVCRAGVIVAANISFGQIAGGTAESFAGQAARTLFEPEEAFDDGAAGAEGPRELTLLTAAGGHVPVEVVSKPILFGGAPHHVVAVRDLRERRKVEREMRFLAHHDALTSLANRLAFGIELDRQCREQGRHGRGFGLLAVDLDRFKDVNDMFGHQMGDRLLQCVADRLRATVREADTIARLGGDEFAIVASAPADPADLAILAQRVVDVVRRPYVLDGKVVTIGCSVGVAVAPRDGAETALLQHNADLALYRSKAEGRNTMRFFEPGMDVRMRERRALEADLRQAVAEGELEVFYQPLFDVGEQAVRGFEALVRWRSPARGLVLPGLFIPVAEETGLIVAIGERVLEAATRQAAAWGGVSMAVNLSAVQFTSGDLVGSVRQALARSGLQAGSLELEITESVLLGDGGRDGDGAFATLHALRALGVRISMDDFGSGYSSLRYLRTFPFDRIKIDASFVEDMLGSPESSAVVDAVLGLGRRLGITITAEGVETAEQRDYLERQGCDLLQGFLFGRPAPAEEASRFVALPQTAAA